MEDDAALISLEKYLNILFPEPCNKSPPPNELLTRAVGFDLWKSQNKYIGMSPEEIKVSWKEENDKAIEVGLRIHEDLIREKDWSLERNVFLRLDALNKGAYRALDTKFYGSDGIVTSQSTTTTTTTSL